MSRFRPTVYCLLVNRTQFLREQAHRPHRQTVSGTRAILCELVAIRVLRRFDEANPGRQGLLLLANILVAGFRPFQNAPPEIIQDYISAIPKISQHDDSKRESSALEVAILSDSKSFLSSTASQRVVDAIYCGQISYSPTSFLGNQVDQYKRKSISLYDASKAPILDQNRLTVPRTRNVLDVLQFIILLVLYLFMMNNRDETRFTKYEVLFNVYALGWALLQFASILEHGWQVYTQNLWAFLDAIFCIIYGIYCILRLHGSATRNVTTSDGALSVLAMAAPILIPRLAFNLMSENLLFISLRDMIANFMILSVLAVWCFGGFLLAMGWLCGGHYQSITISKWMLMLWFGLDATGIQRSGEFHWLLGPILMVTFALFGNTLFLTIVLSMLSNTFAIIVSDATAEIRFRRAVLTFEGIRSDAFFAFQPPFNILALLILLPSKLLLRPERFREINVVIIHILNAPLLYIIGFCERSLLQVTPKRSPANVKHRCFFGVKNFSKLFVAADIEAVFDIESPQSVVDDGDGNFVATSPASSIHTRPSQRQDDFSCSPESRKTRLGLGYPNGITDPLSSSLQKHDTSIDHRLEAIEKSMENLGKLVQGLCELVHEKSLREINQHDK